MACAILLHFKAAVLHNCGGVTYEPGGWGCSVPVGKTLFRTADLAKLAAAKRITRPFTALHPRSTLYRTTVQYSSTVSELKPWQRASPITLLPFELLQTLALSCGYRQQ
jgi:hypothetical protein